jgi:hypothetical protein
MDEGESVCPQCGAGLKEYAARKRAAEAAKAAKAPAVELPRLDSPSARRLYLRGKLQKKAIAPRWFPPWLTRFLLLANVRPEPPSAQRVMVRALALAAVAARADQVRPDAQGQLPDLLSRQIADGLHRHSGTGELEPNEKAFCASQPGALSDSEIAGASWRAEGAGVLLWALGLWTAPEYDMSIDVVALLQKTVELAGNRDAKDLFKSARLRPAEEIDKFATHATIVSWRLRQFGMQPGPMDFLGFLRAFSTCKESWFEGLRIIDGDLAIGARAISDAPLEAVQICSCVAIERHIAAYWLQGDSRLYSQIDPTTILSAC